MKRLLIGLAIATTLVSCNTGEQKSNTATSTDASKSKASAPSTPYTPPNGVDANLSASIKGIVDGYLHLKDALTKDNSKDAAAAGSEILTAMSKVDTGVMNESQRKVYAEVSGDVLEHAEHIRDNSGKISHQREHFETLSKDVEDLVKTFGGGQRLYKQHCPMAFEGKGASWLSELEEIRNPYYGDEMLECGEVQETLN